MVLIFTHIYPDLKKKKKKSLFFSILDNNISSTLEISSKQVRKNVETDEEKHLQMDLND